MSWSATSSTISGGDWLQISPASGTVATPYLDVSLVTVTINPTGLSAGTYYGQIQVSAPAANIRQAADVDRPSRMRSIAPRLIARIWNGRLPGWCAGPNRSARTRRGCSSAS
jgi:hypothetical protein